MGLKRFARKIAGKIIMVQSCWVDKDLDIVVNLSIGVDGTLVHRQRLQISGKQITYPNFIPYKQIGKQMTHLEFDAFLNDNFEAVLGLVMSLLEPGEVALLGVPGVKELELEF